MKVVQKDWFQSQTRRLKTKLTLSFTVIEKRDYPIVSAKWMRHMVLFRILLQKSEISKNMQSLDTAYRDCQTVCCVCRHLQKEFRLLSKRGEHISQPHSNRRWIMVPLSRTNQSKQSSLTWSTKIPHHNKNKVKNLRQKSDIHAIDVSGPILVRMDAQRHNNKCCMTGRHSHEVAHKHRKSSERKIKRRNHVILHNNTRALKIGLTQSMLITLKFEVLKHPVFGPRS